MTVHEVHHAPSYYAKLWNRSQPTIRSWFVQEPGVTLVGKPARRVAGKMKRSYYTMQIPESVAARVYARMTVKKKV